MSMIDDALNIKNPNDEYLNEEQKDFLIEEGFSYNEFTERWTYERERLGYDVTAYVKDTGIMELYIGKDILEDNEVEETYFFEQDDFYEEYHRMIAKIKEFFESDDDY